VAVDLFYLRATALISEQRLPEAIAAIRVVTELQPHVAEGWAMLGSLLAWRNSATARDAAEQWRYAREGLSIVERGIAWNPSSPALASAYAELLFLRVVREEGVRGAASARPGGPRRRRPGTRSEGSWSSAPPSTRRRVSRNPPGSSASGSTRAATARAPGRRSGTPCRSSAGSPRTPRPRRPAGAWRRSRAGSARSVLGSGPPREGEEDARLMVRTARFADRYREGPDYNLALVKE